MNKSLPYYGQMSKWCIRDQFSYWWPIFTSASRIYDWCLKFFAGIPKCLLVSKQKFGIDPKIILLTQPSFVIWGGFRPWLSCQHFCLPFCRSWVQFPPFAACSWGFLMLLSVLLVVGVRLNNSMNNCGTRPGWNKHDPKLPKKKS